MQLQVLEKNLKERASNVEGTFDSLYFHILMNIAICMYYWILSIMKGTLPELCPVLPTPWGRYYFGYFRHFINGISESFAILF